jgi:hypothetical protein
MDFRKHPRENGYSILKTKKEVLNRNLSRTPREEYTAADKEVKRNIKKDERKYVNSLAREAEQAAGKRSVKDLYMLSRKLSAKFQRTEKPVKDTDGNPPTTTKEQLLELAEHFATPEYGSCKYTTKHTTGRN